MIGNCTQIFTKGELDFVQWLRLMLSNQRLDLSMFPGVFLRQQSRKQDHSFKVKQRVEETWESPELAVS